MAVDLDGRKHVLGLQLGQGDEGAEYWLGVLSELHNRGVDVSTACCDDLTGFGDTIEATWPQTTLQTCVVHLIRNSIRFCSWKDRRQATNSLKPIYTAPSGDAAMLALEDFGLNGARPMGRFWSYGIGTGIGLSVPGNRPIDPQDHLHHQRYSVAEFPAPQGHQDQELVSYR